MPRCARHTLLSSCGPTEVLVADRRSQAPAAGRDQKEQRPAAKIFFAAGICCTPAGPYGGVGAGPTYNHLCF